MTSEEQIREKLRKISALFEGATTIGERNAAAAAIERVKKALGAVLEIRAARRIPVHIARSLAETLVLGAVPPLRSGAVSLQSAALYDGDGAGPQVFRRQDAMAGVPADQGRAR